MRAITFITAIFLASSVKAGFFEMPQFVEEIKQKIPFLKDKEQPKREPEEDNDSG